MYPEVHVFKLMDFIPAERVLLELSIPYLVTLGRIATQGGEISCAFANTVFSMSITTWHLPLMLTEIKMRAGTDTHVDWLWVPCLYLKIA